MPLRTLDDRLATMDDWRLLLTLDARPDCHGLITTDSSMLRQPRELCALEQTDLALVVSEGAGHDPVKASGLLFTHLARIAQEVTAGTPGPRVWRLQAGVPRATAPTGLLRRIATHRNEDVRALRRASRPTRTEIATIRAEGQDCGHRRP